MAARNWTPARRLWDGRRHRLVERHFSLDKEFGVGTGPPRPGAAIRVSKRKVQIMAQGMMEFWNLLEMILGTILSFADEIPI